ncbi:MAG: CHASE2 domain-containing protein [Scytonematopsis contorta HA4267-MV1]|jgi:CHASE2 domain-containing sensor protein|nr:CHASE2 domain-containing protein [Scytonematopsis contorta HA4267-MV1]
MQYLNRNLRKTLQKNLSKVIPHKYTNGFNQKLKKFTVTWHGTLVVTPTIAGLTILVRLLGWFQPLEYATLDISFRLRPEEAVDERIIIVAVEESDLSRLKQWPLSDELLAKLLTNIKQQNPKVIGLDIYRNLPVEPGNAELKKVFKETSNLFGIQKVIGDRFSPEIPPSPVLSQLGQVTSNDVVVDEDGVVRRGMLFPIPGEPLPSLGLTMAMEYLRGQGIEPESAKDGAMKLGNTVFDIFESNDGNYLNADAGGYQIILNYRGAANSFQSVPLTDVLENRVPPNLMRDRIVLIGAKAPSLNDAFYTPYSRGFFGTPVRTPGVEVQANVTSQILSSVLDSRPLIKVWYDPLEKVWIVLWILIIASFGWHWRYTKAHFYILWMLSLLLVNIAIVSFIGYVSFLLGWWIPVISPLMGLLASTIAISSYVYVSKLRELNKALEKSNVQLEQSHVQLEETIKDLEHVLSDLQKSQLQLIQSEKMSALGQLVAGVAHEINNPVGFISGNLKHLEGYIQDLTNHLQLYQQTFPEAGEEIEEDAEAIDIEYVLEDIPKMVESMQVGIQRIKEISTSLRTFSRSDTSTKANYNIHEGIDSTLLILKHRLKADSIRPEIKIIKEYGNLPMVNCYPGQLNQVIMNLIANAIDALEDSNKGKEFAEIEANPNKITISTKLLADNTRVVIQIKDNGLGMSDEIKQKIFEHLFTTKPVGQGTGLGLSISRQIVEETHGGKLSCISSLGDGAEFLIEIPIE